MNELLGWYGYENVDRSDLGRASKQLATEAHQRAQPSQSKLNHHSSITNQIRLIKTPAAAVNNPALRSDKIPTTPDRLANNSSPESSSRYSKSPAAALAGQGSESVTDEKKGDLITIKGLYFHPSKLLIKTHSNVYREASLCVVSIFELCLPHRISQIFHPRNQFIPI